jgi:hypothetical protein
LNIVPTTTEGSFNEITKLNSDYLIQKIEIQNKR